MRLLIKLILLLGACGLSAFAYAKPDRSSALHALVRAMNYGSASEVHRIVQAGPVDPHIAGIAKAQLNYNIQRLNQLAKQCDKEPLSDVHTLVEADYCSGIAASAATFLGDPRDVLSQLPWIQTYLDPQEAAQLGHKTPNKNPFANLTLAESKSIVSHTPHVPLDWQADEKTIPVDHAGAFPPIEPSIRVNINGHTISALINMAVPFAFSVLIVRSTTSV